MLRKNKIKQKEIMKKLRKLAENDLDGAAFNSSDIRSTNIAIDSAHVWLSTFVINSKHVSNSDFIIDSVDVWRAKDVFGSSGVKESYDIRNSIDVKNSRLVDNSTGVLNSFLVSGSGDVRNCYGLKNCNVVKNCLFCFDINRKQDYIFNQKVSGDRFVEVWQDIKNFNFYPSYSKSRELIIYGRNKIFFFSMPRMMVIDNKTAWRKMPEKMRQYITSLPEFDEKIFKAISG